MSKNTAARTFLFTALVTLAGATYAMGPWAGDRFGGPEGGWVKLRHLVHALSLSEEQERQIADIFHDARDSTLSDRHRMKELYAQLQQQRSAFDAGKAQAIADEIGQITARTVYALASAQAQVYATLDEQQQSRFDEVAARRGPGARGKHRGD